MSKKKKVRSADPPPTMSEDEVDRILYQWSIPPEGRDGSTPPAPGTTWSEEWNQALRSMGVDPDAISMERRTRLDRRVHSFYRDKNFERVRKELVASTPPSPTVIPPERILADDEKLLDLSKYTPPKPRTPSVAAKPSEGPTTPPSALTPPIALDGHPGRSTAIPRGFKPPKSRPGSPAALINAVLTFSPQTIEELSTKSGIAYLKVKDHVKYWKKKGIIEENEFGFFWKES